MINLTMLEREIIREALKLLKKNNRKYKSPLGSTWELLDYKIAEIQVKIKDIEKRDN